MMHAGEQGAKTIVSVSGGPDVALKGLIGVLEQLDCAVVEMTRCPGTDVYSLQIICSAHRTAAQLRRVSGVVRP